MNGLGRHDPNPLHLRKLLDRRVRNGLHGAELVQQPASQHGAHARQALDDVPEALVVRHGALAAAHGRRALLALLLATRDGVQEARRLCGVLRGEERHVEVRDDGRDGAVDGFLGDAPRREEALAFEDQERRAVRVAQRLHLREEAAVDEARREVLGLLALDAHAVAQDVVAYFQRLGLHDAVRLRQLAHDGAAELAVVGDDGDLGFRLGRRGPGRLERLFHPRRAGAAGEGVLPGRALLAGVHLREVALERLDLGAHLLLLAARGPLVALVARLLRDEDDDAARAPAARPAAPLDGADLAGHGLLEDDEGTPRDAQALLRDARGDERVVLAGLEVLHHLDLLLLRHAAVGLGARGLPHEARGAHAFDGPELLDERLGRVAIVREHEDARVRLLLELLAQ